MTTTTNNASPVSVLRVGSSDETLAKALMDAVVGHLRKPDSQPSAADDNDTYLLPISNRYFDATVALLSLSLSTDSADADKDQQEDGIVLVFDDSSKTAFDIMANLHATAETTGQNGDLLRLCIGILNDNASVDATISPKERETEYSRRVLWCLDHGYEYVERVDLSPTGVQQGHSEREKEGFARIIEAIQGTVWSTAKMHSKKKQQLQQSYQTAVEKLATSTNEPEQESTTDNNNYEPPPTTLPLPTAATAETEEEAKEREEKARQALLQQDGMNSDNTANNPDMYLDGQVPPAEQRQQEQQTDKILGDMEGALKEANRIRDLSRNGQLDDEERRQRAGDAAVLLMNLMNQMGGMSDEEEEDESDGDTSN